MRYRTGWLLPLSMSAAVLAGSASADRLAAPATGPEGIIVYERLENGRFSTSLRGWRPVPLPGSSVSWAAFGTNSVPGSALLTHDLVPNALETELLQCLPNIVPSQPFTVESSWYAESGQPLVANGALYGLVLNFYSSAFCSDGYLGQAFSGYRHFGPGGTGAWENVSATGIAPAGARSAQVIALLRKQSNVGNPPGAASVHLDDVRLLGTFGFVKGSFIGSGETDLLLRNTATNEHRVWLMQEELRVGDQPITPSVPAPWQVAGVDDFDADGKNDLLVWHPANGWLDLWFMNGLSRPGPAMPLSEDPGPGWTPSATADFNRDGHADIVLRNPTTQAIRIWTMSGATRTGTITPTPAQAVDGNWEIVGAQDLDGDDDVDFLWYNSTSGRIVYWLMDAGVVRTAGAFTNPMSAGNSNWKVLAMGDYGIGPSSGGQALAGTKDIVWRNATSGAMVVWFMDRSGNRTSGLFVNPAQPPAPATDWTVAGPR